jgi:hypothetical protein
MAVFIGGIGATSKVSKDFKKSLKSYVGLFDVDFVSKFLKKEGFNYVRFREKFSPNEGVKFPLSFFISNAKKDILESKYSQIVFHKNGNITIKTPKGYFEFF